MGFNFLLFFCGVCLGMFVAVLVLAQANRREEQTVMTPEEFREYYKAWDEINDEYDVFNSATADEIFLGLGDDDES